MNLHVFHPRRVHPRRVHPRRVHPRRVGAALACVVLSVSGALGACSSDDDATTSTAAPTDQTTEPDGAGEPAIEVTGAWARTSPMNAENGAIYLVIANDGDAGDALVSASVAAEVATTAELHETRAVTGGGESEDTMGGGTTTGEDGSGMDGSGMDGTGSSMGDGDGTAMMEMVEVDRIEVPAGGTAVLEPGGFHVMLLGLVEPLEDGDVISLTLTFEVAGEITVDAVVGTGAP